MADVRLIDANEPIKATESTIHLLKKQNLPTEAHETFLRWLKNFPTVDAVEVVHGRWLLERTPDGKPYCFHCSVCDDDFGYIGISTAYRYCPNCGAKMDGDGNG